MTSASGGAEGRGPSRKQPPRAAPWRPAVQRLRGEERVPPTLGKVEACGLQSLGPDFAGAHSTRTVRGQGAKRAGRGHSFGVFQSGLARPGWRGAPRGEGSSLLSCGSSGEPGQPLLRVTAWSPRGRPSPCTARLQVGFEPGTCLRGGGGRKRRAPRERGSSTVESQALRGSSPAAGPQGRRLCACSGQQSPGLCSQLSG